MNPVYIGDGIYAKEGRWVGEIIVFTSNGITESNHIYLGAREMESLVRFWELYKAEKSAETKGRT